MSKIVELIKEHCPNGVEYKTIDECIVLNFGTRITKAKNLGTEYPVYGGGGESFRTDDYNREDEYVVSRFAMSEKCVRWVDGKFWMLDSGFTFVPKSPDINKKYIAYNLFNMQPKIYACTSQGAQRNLKVDAFKKFKIPVPPIEVQEEIVRLLDTMCELEESLKAELEARHAQYEHYRDELLNFDKLESVE